MHPQPIQSTSFIQVLDDLGEAALLVEGVRILSANDAFCRMSGYASEHLLSLSSCLELAPVDEKPLLELRWKQRLAAPGSISRFETRMRHREGHVIHLSVAVKPLLAEGLRCVVLVRDITEQKRIEEALRRANEQFAIILEGVADGIFAIDASGDLIYANEAALRFYNFPHGKANLAEWRAHLAHHVTYSEIDGRPIPFERLPSLRALAGEVVPEHVMNYDFRETGERRVAMVKATPAFDEHGRVRFGIAIVHDLTERMRLERLKGDFLNAVTHELRTPLTSIKAYAEFLEDELLGPLSPEQHAFLAQLQRGAQQLELLVDDLLDYARIEAGEFAVRRQPCDASAILRQVGEAFDPIASARELSLTVSAPPSPLEVLADPNRLVQILNNLLSNALKFTPPGGSVTLSLSQSDTETTFVVADTGIGILAEHLPHLFEKFFQAESSLTRSYKGTGLGLPITKALVEAHQGTISVASTPGEGATFTVHLPHS
ncbi:PAS domain S-box protein [bacterium]|nr:PAS domain S-box protein [bacterium]